MGAVADFLATLDSPKIYEAVVESQPIFEAIVPGGVTIINQTTAVLKTAELEPTVDPEVWTIPEEPANGYQIFNQIVAIEGIHFTKSGLNITWIDPYIPADTDTPVIIYTE